MIENDEVDDDFVNIGSKRQKVDLNDTCDTIETCAICFQPWTTSGDHKMTSIKCGHFFGLKCIEKWYQTKTRNASCPICNALFTKNDIRIHYINIKCVELVDNSEYVEAIAKLEASNKKVAELEMDNSHLKLNNQMLILEKEKLEKEIRSYQEQYSYMKHDYENAMKSEYANFLGFNLMKKITISNTGNCRVLDYSPLNNFITVSCPSSYAMFNSFGIRVIDANQMRPIKFQPLHSSMIRQIAFEHMCTNNMMLTCSLDKSVKLTNIHCESVIFTTKLPQPVWSICWSNNPHEFYAGLANGEVHLIDKRKPDAPVSHLWTKPGGPIFSIEHINANNHVHKNGLLISNAQGTVFLPKSFNNAVENSDDNTNSQFDTVLLSSHYKGSLASSAFNASTGHIFSTLRQQYGPTKMLLSEIGTTESSPASGGSVYAADIQQFIGSGSSQYMTKSNFINLAGEFGTCMLCPNEEKSSIAMYSSVKNKPITTVSPPEVTRQKPIIDLCQLGSNSNSFAAVNSNNLYIYTAIH